MAHLDTAVAPAFTAEHTAARRLMHAIALRHAPGDGTHATTVPGLQLLRASAPSGQVAVMYRPALCLLLGGAKRIFLSDQVTEYTGSCHLVVSQDLPVLGQVIEASEASPYLCVHLAIDLGEVIGLILDHPELRAPPAATREAARGLCTEPTTPELMGALLRLLQLLDAPRDRAVLAPLVKREILYRLLASPEGWRLARTVLPGSHEQRIARVIALMRERFRETLSITELAQAAHLSPSALHQHFKAVTSETPLRYLKQLKLQEARRLLLTEGLDAASAGFMVGYESASQFTREYARMFGAPPARDRDALRGSAV
ncbi:MULTISPECIES: AraC family transcriptional regulator [unclassified Roseateles]|uniref:AraC family transcriptional regulator n=1 Tax=unclassified Roseateles TaxID=2626991 RepID=UPI0009EC7826|nr:MULTISPECIES: AraC family transcriptional regulator [unclassified Roseateles]